MRHPALANRHKPIELHSDVLRRYLEYPVLTAWLACSPRSGRARLEVRATCLSAGATDAPPNSSGDGLAERSPHGASWLLLREILQRRFDATWPLADRNASSSWYTVQSTRLETAHGKLMRHSIIWPRCASTPASRRAVEYVDADTYDRHRGRFRPILITGHTGHPRGDGVPEVRGIWRRRPDLNRGWRFCSPSVAFWRLLDP